MSAVRICTIGYESWGHDAWIAALHEHGIRIVVDVRELPLSRRPGWSKTALAARLADNGIGYVHMRALGTPAPLRHGLRDSSLSFAEFTEQFNAILDDRMEELEALLRLAQAQPVVLMCWEEDPARCHRSLVVNALAQGSERQLEIVDIRRLGEGGYDVQQRSL
jgi:uncharacterized protein (DUF488 family)